MEALLRFWITVWVLGSASCFRTKIKDGKYFCHCMKGCNETDGKCLESCDPNHFGPFCQYTDIGWEPLATRTPLVLFDKDHSTCVTDSSLWVARYASNTFPYVFHSALFILKQSEQGKSFFGKINITFRKSEDNETLFPCINKDEVPRPELSKHHIGCEPTVYTEIIFTGPMVPFLCTIQISTGRNVVTLQKAETEGKLEFSSLPTFANDHAVKNCLSMSSQRQPPMLKIIMRAPVFFTSLMIVASEQQSSFEDASIEGLYEDSVAFSLQADGSILQPKKIRDQFWWPFVFEKKIPITSLIIKKKTSLTVCEVKGYGDSACPHGYVGFDCEVPCLCADNRTCLTSAWLCGPKGCNPGYTGRRCDKEYTKGKYGLKCAQACPAYCADGNCRKENGECFHCPNGMYGALCDQEVDPETSVRVTPKKPCENCRNRKCDKNGHCLEGCVSGYLDSTCDLKCPHNHYGDFCAHRCPSSCLTDACHFVDGTCLDGCKDGYLGNQCGQECLNGTYGQDCELNCSIGCLFDSANESLSVCNFVNGTCLFGCRLGYSGIYCDEFDHSGNPSDFISMLQFLATVFFVVSMTVLLILLCWRKKDVQELSQSSAMQCESSFSHRIVL